MLYHKPLIALASGSPTLYRRASIQPISWPACSLGDPGQVEVDARYYQEVASGTVMIGEAANCEAHRELFGWPKLLSKFVPMRPSSLLFSVTSIPIGNDSRRNAKEAVPRHDWVCQNEMFRVAGIEPSRNMAARERSA